MMTMCLIAVSPTGVGETAGVGGGPGPAVPPPPLHAAVSAVRVASAIVAETTLNSRRTMHRVREQGHRRERTRDDPLARTGEPLLDYRRVDAAEVDREFDVAVVEVVEGGILAVQTALDAAADEHHRTRISVIRAAARALRRPRARCFRPRGGRTRRTSSSRCACRCRAARDRRRRL